ncbi:hypothetical protein Taro_028917 [Colocasia esculenta]|uniref:Uncharacterized protein n=1 Tax=Colocasia esculenta TaxID=4460 RepID=A0A843VHM8_COLES|nr:hypothetical protein [Colocasia esculenta]
MAADYWLAAIPLDVDPSWRPPPWTSAWCWQQDPLTSTGFTRSPQLPRDSSPLAPFSRPCNACDRSQRAYRPPRHPIDPEHCERDRGALFLWPADGGEVEAPSPSAARGYYNNVVKTLPWVQIRPWRSQTSPFISGFLCFLLSQPSQPCSQRGQPATHHRQRETSDVREPPEDIHSRDGDMEAKRIVHSLFYGDHGGTTVLLRFLCI